MPEEIKPCPFCGNPELIVENGYTGSTIRYVHGTLRGRDKYYYVICCCCGANLNDEDNDSKYKAIEAWNKRA